jgi:hypothetical protein
MPELNPTIPRAAFVPRLLRLTPQPRAGESRAMISTFAENAFHQFGSTNAFTDYVASRQGLYINCNLLEGIPKVDGLYSLYLRHEEPIDQYLLKISPDPDRQYPELLDFLAVAQITAPGKFFDFAYRPTHMPMVSAGQKPVFQEDRAVLAAIASRDFHPRREVNLPPETREQVTVTNQTEARVLSSAFEANGASLAVLARQPSMVVVAQSYHHSWRAYVDNRAVPVLRANYAYQAVQVPDGRHEVRLVYEDDFFRGGAIISVLALAGCAWGVGTRRRRGDRPAVARRDEEGSTGHRAPAS